MKKIFRKIIRKLFYVQEFENISDAINRKKFKFFKLINHKCFSTLDFKKRILELGLKEGDTVIVHSAWRAFIGYLGTPNDIIDCLKDIIGENGTIVMPCYTNNKQYFDYNDKTSAGVLAETFREDYCQFRSLDSFFSMASAGKNAKFLTESHIDSDYYFDEKSPYYKAIMKNAKIILLGLGKHPHKISLFHCITYELKNTLSCYKNIYTSKKSVVLVDKKGNVIKKQILDRKQGCNNNKRKFKKLFKNVNTTNCYSKINFLDIYLIDSKKIYDDSKKYIIKHNYNLYK